MTFREPEDLQSLVNEASSQWQGFTYISGSFTNSVAGLAPSAEIFHPQADDQPVDIYPNSVQSYPLSEVQTGDRLRVVSLNCGDSNPRLMAMGLMPGTEVQVISHTRTGSVILAFGQNRLGLGADLTPHIQVAIPEHAAPSSAPSMRNTPMNLTSEAQYVSLQSAKHGERFRIVGYAPSARAYKRKLLAMGLTPGTEFTVTRNAPLGDPTEIEIRGFHLSLRKQEANALQLEQLQSL
jgi:ferrous iron transport protein A